MFILPYSSLREDLPELDIISSSLDGRIEMLLSTEFSCAGDACLDTSDRLFNRLYNATSDLTATIDDAKAQCEKGDGREVANILCF